MSISITSNTSARFVAAAVGVATAFGFAFAAVVPAQAATVMCPGTTWTRNLQVGANGADVMALQQYLNMSAATMVAASGAGSPGMETMHFGPATKAAVMKFQTANSISPVAGFVGPLTRAKVNAMCAGSTSTPTPTPTPTSGTGLMVSAAAQPANGIAVSGASRVPFTTFTVTAGNDGDVTMTGVLVQRAGVINKAAFDGVVLIDGNGQIVGSSKTLNSNDQATVGATTVIPRGTSMTFTVAGNMTATSPNSYAGQVGGLQVVAINTTAAVTGALPISGAMHTFNSTLTIGTMTAITSSFDPGSSQSQPIGTTGQRFAGIQLTSGSAEDVRVKSVRWYQTGSASAGDIANVMINANGTDYPAMVSSDGKYYTANFGSGIVVAKGFSIDVYIKGDIVGTGASNRTIKFNIDRTTDVYATGEKYGFGITPTASSASDSAQSNSISGFVSTSSSAQPWFDGSQITITAGSVTSISKANEVAAQNVALNVQNQPLGGFVTDFKGEAITVQTMAFTLSTTTGMIPDLLTNVSLVSENGSVVAGPVDATWTSSAHTQQTITLSDSVSFPVGRHVYTLKGKLPSTATNGTVFTIASNPYSAWSNVKGDTTGTTITLPNATVTMNAMTVKAAALAITVASTPSAQSIVAGSQGYTFANYQLDGTQSGEDVRFSAIPLYLTAVSGAATDLTNCKLYNGSTAVNTGSNVINPAAGANSFTLDQSLTVPKGTVMTLALKCDVSSSASGSYKWGIQDTTGTVVTGVTSNSSVTENVTTSLGNLMSIASGALVASLDSSSPSYKVVPAGSTDVVVNAIKFRPSNENQTLRRVGLKLTYPASTSPADLVRVTLWVGATQIGQATFTGANNNATSTAVGGSGDMSYVMPADTDTVVTVKADIATIGTNQPATSGHSIIIDVDTNGTNTQSTGVGSGATINASGSTASAGVRIFKSVPTFTYSTTGATASQGVNDLLVLNVAADAKGEVQLYKLSFTVATTTTTLTSPTFSGPNGSVGTVALNTAGTAITATFDSSSNTSDRIIPAGGSKTYTLRGTLNITGNNTTGSVSVALAADTAYPSLATTFMAQTGALSASKTIWSPDSTTTADTTALDWTNGYGLGGCFTQSGLGTDCTARVIAK